MPDLTPPLNQSLVVALMDDDTVWLAAYKQLLATLPQVASVHGFSSPEGLFAWLADGHRADRYILDYDVQALHTGVEVGQRLLERYEVGATCILVSSATHPDAIAPHPFAFCSKNRVVTCLPQWLTTPISVK